MEDCPVFSYNSEPGSCALENPLPAEIASEDVKGPMQGLPNRVQVQSGPEPASPRIGSSPGHSGKEVEPAKNQKDASDSAPTAIVKIPTVPVSDSSEPTSSREADQGRENRYNQQAYSEKPPKGLFKTADASSLSSYAATSSSSSTPAPAPTNKPDQAPVAVQVGKAISTAYWTSGREAHEVIVILEEVTITAEGGKVTKTEEAAGAEMTPQLYKRQQHKHHHHQHAGRGIGGRKMRWMDGFLILKGTSSDFGVGGKTASEGRIEIRIHLR